ncbi:MAG: hypothetical protein WEA61_04895 [Anaerolineales bacterium]
MKARKTVVVLATVALLLAAVPALAAPRFDTVGVSVDNRTGASVAVTLNGPGMTETVFLASEQNAELDLIPGSYFYKYTACGHLNTGTFMATEGEPTLVLKKCAGVALSNIVIENLMNSPFIVTLTGVGGLYGYWVPQGGITISLPAGGYQFSSNACGAGSGTLKASASLPQPLTWTWTCDGVTLTASAD